MIFTQIHDYLNLTNVTFDNGLPCQGVENGMVDNLGMVWISTYCGLVRYDGTEFKTFRNNPRNPGSLPRDLIYKIIEDKNGNFYLAHSQGLSYLNKTKEEIINYDLKKISGNKITNIDIHHLEIDQEGTIWLGNYEQIYSFDPIKNKIKEIILPKVNPVRNRVRQIFLDKNKTIWILYEGSVYQWDSASKKVVLKVKSNDIVNLYQDHDGLYWILTWGKGVAPYDGLHAPLYDKYIDNDNIYLKAIHPKNTNNIYLVTAEGLNILDKTTLNITKYYFKDEKTNNLFPNITNVFADKSNNIWFTSSYGLQLLDLDKQVFQKINSNIFIQENAENKVPFPVFFDTDKIWIGSWHSGGYTLVDYDFNLLKHWPSLVPGSTKSYHQSFYDIYKESYNSYWVTSNESLLHMHLKNNKTEEFFPYNHTFDKNNLRKILPLSNNRLLIMSKNSGLYCFDIQRKSFLRNLDNINKQLGDIYIEDIIQVGHGLFYLIGNKGLFKLDVEKDTLMPTRLTTYCRSIALDKSQQIWVGTDSGLLKYHDDFINQYSTFDGLSQNTIVDMVCDKNNNLWLLTYSGVSVFNIKSAVFNNLYSYNGLPKNKIEGSLYICPDGDILLTDENNVMLKFDPDKFFLKRSIAHAEISDIYVNNQLYYPLKYKNNEKQIIVQQASSNIQIKFSVLNYADVRQIEFYYKLSGLDNDWQLSNKGRITFNNLEPGYYKLFMKGIYIDDKSETQQCILHIKVNPEWFESWWFRMIAWTFLCFILYLLYRYRIKEVNKEEGYKRKLIETNVQLLRTQMNPHFIFNSINSIENFVMRNEKKLASDYLIKFARLIRGILENSKNSLISITSELETLNLYVDLELMRFNHRFQFISEIDPKILNDNIQFPPLVIQPFIENAIVHGLSHSENKLLFVKLKIKYFNENIILVVIEDNGIGRDHANNIKMNNNPKHFGMGIKTTEERIKIFNLPYQWDIHIYDQIYNNGNASGTKIEFYIKVVTG